MHRKSRNQIVLKAALPIVLAALVAGCARKEEAAAPPEASSRQTALAPDSARDVSVDPAGAATIRGRVLFGGQVPAPQEIPVKGNPECAVFHPSGNVTSEELLVNQGGLQNAFVYVKEGLEALSFAAPSEPVVIENKNCVYVPHVTGVQVGQPVTILNSDPTLHNVHSYGKVAKPWNIGLPVQGMKIAKKFSEAEVMVTLKCDVHPWMLGYVGVLPHPYFDVTGPDGGFEIKNLPPGEYVLEVWHEKLGVQTQKIKLEPRAETSVDFSF